MDTKVDPATPPLSAAELAKDSRSSSPETDAPPLKEADEASAVEAREYTTDEAERGSDSNTVIERALIKLPPG